ncbi:MAG TPA: hypothetical protein EYO73_04220 [Sulfurimonas sp.]|nr:hypothetical protein [Sulfurimonas sp.]
MFVFIVKIIDIVSRIADTDLNTTEEKRQHRFLIYMGILMSVGGMFWGSICIYIDFPFQATLPLGYPILTALNYFYLYLTKDFKTSQSIQISISLFLPFFFQLSLGGFVASGGVVF